MLSHAQEEAVITLRLSVQHANLAYGLKGKVGEEGRRVIPLGTFFTTLSKTINNMKRSTILLPKRD